jgi:hypothetical protein
MGGRNLTGRSLVSGFVDAPGRRDDIVAYADTIRLEEQGAIWKDRGL